jgi:transcription elongation factor/antiterminator RfaH
MHHKHRHWHVAQLRPNQLSRALKHLKNQEIEAYNPMMTREHVVKGHVVIDSFPIFAGYLFVLFAPTADNIVAVHSTRGILRLVRPEPDAPPSRVPADVLNEIKRKETSGAFHFSSIKRIKKGDVVRVKLGERMGMRGLVTLSEDERVELLLDLLNRKVLVKAPRHMVEKIEPDAARKIERRAVR